MDIVINIILILMIIYCVIHPIKALKVIVALSFGLLLWIILGVKNHDNGKLY
jgi:hypothetical protein